MKRLPLRNRSGEVVAYTLVDDQDYERAVGAGPWRLDSSGYAYKGYRPRGQPKKVLFLHRFILGITEYGIEADHIDRHPLNNQRANLRITTRAQNRQNLASYRGSSSPYRGVSWFKGTRKWRAQVRLNGKDHYLGLFEDEEEAAAVAAAFRRLHMPFSSDANAS